MLILIWVSETAAEHLKPNVAGYFNCCLNNRQIAKDL